MNRSQLRLTFENPEVLILTHHCQTLYTYSIAIEY